jgi:hypothetical protein
MRAAKILIIIVFLLVFAVQVLAQTGKTTRGLDSLDLIDMNNKANNSGSVLVTPNELEGYEFFKKGKLNSLRIGISSPADVEKIFGSDCKKGCDYSPDWTLAVDYFDKSAVLVSRTYDKTRNAYTEKQFVPKKEIVGKIESISFQPKKKVSFINTVFPAEFTKYSVVDPGFINLERKDAFGASIDFYMDSYGLQYLIFDKIVNDQLKDTFNLRKSFAKFQKGDLISIKYTITEAMESRFWVEEQ